MIFGRVGHSQLEEQRRRSIAAAMALYGGEADWSDPADGEFLSGRGGRVGAHGGVAALVYGWIDNAADLGSDLGVASSDTAGLYAAAVARWGDEADRRIIGSYAAIATRQDGSLRCSRSPWDAPPLHYAFDEHQAIISPLLRCLFAAGIADEIDRERLIDELAIDRRTQEDAGWYRGTWRVPLGAVVHLAAGTRRVERWYRPPMAIAPDRLVEEEAVEEALRLLDEAAARAMAWAHKPALSLSGGLDSTLAATSLLQSLGPREELTAITWVPDRDWSGHVPPGKFGDESVLASELVAANPGIDWHLTGRDVGSFDRHAREIYSAMACFAPGLANVGAHHDVFATAKALGCDAVLNADGGNATFSEAGEAAYREYPWAGEFRQYMRLMRQRPNDPRPLWRRIAALTVLPSLPQAIRRQLRAWAHPSRRDPSAHFSPLSSRALREQRSRAEARGSQAAWADYTHDRDRAAAVERCWEQADGVQHDVNLAFEQVYGIRRRDVTAYRPLIEFCMTLPTRAFAWDGRERRLARLMGQRRVPQAIHANILHGQHNVDWRERIGRDRENLSRLFRSAEDHPILGDILDIERLIATLDQWTDQPDPDWEADMGRCMSITRALMAVRFVGAMEVRNEF